MDWFNQMLSNQQFKNVLGLSNQALTLLAADFNRFQLLEADLPQRVLSYVVDGDDEAALSDMIRQVQANLQNNPFTSSLITGALQDYEKASAILEKAQKARIRFLKLGQGDAALYYRLAQIYSIEATHPHSSQTIRLGASAWLDPFLIILKHGGQYVYLTSDEHSPASKFDISQIEAMLVLAEEQPERLAQAAYLTDLNDWNAKHIAPAIASLKNFADYSLKYQAIVTAALTHANLQQRVHALEILAQGKVPIAPFAEVLCDRATSSAKSEREFAAALLQQDKAAAIPHLKQKAEKGKADERLYAVKLLHDLAGEEVKDFLEQRSQVEKAAKVKDTIQQLFTVSTQVATVPVMTLSLPPIAEVNSIAPLPETVFDVLQQMLVGFNSEAQTHYEKYKSTDQWLKPPQFAEAKIAREAFELLQQGTAKQCTEFSSLGIGYFHLEPFRRSLTTFLEQPLQLIHVVRLLLLTQIITIQVPYGRKQRSDTKLSVDARGSERFLQHYSQSHALTLDLRELVAVLDALGLDSDSIADDIISTSYRWSPSPFLRWADEAVWPYFAERLHLFDEILNPKPQSSSSYDYGRADKRKAAFAVLEKFPQPPASLMPKLWEIAISGSKEAALVQPCLDQLTDLPERLIQALKDTNQTVRTTAAHWLARGQFPHAIPHLKQALKQEKSDAVKDALIRSLERLGASVDEFLDRTGLLKEAQAGLKKGIPDALSWFPCDRLPTVHWIDTNEAVEPEILTWFLVQSHKQKNPEPGPMLRRYVEYFKPTERQQLGQFVLDSWLGQDTIPKYTPAEAEPIAKQEAATRWTQTQHFLANTPDTEEKIYQQEYNRQLQWYSKHKTITDEQKKQIEQSARWQASWTFRQRQENEAASEAKYHQEAMNRLLAELKGSAIKDKGVLAIAGACCGASAVPVISNYLKTYYGKRIAQCTALIQMLSWVEDFSAIQLLLSVANRFRTKGIQEEAERCVNRVAERKGWTRDELGDRTIPWCGFTDPDKMVLDYGLRQFIARLDQNFNFVLTDDSGKVIKSLPDARKDEAEDQIKAVKKQFSEAKKQLKQVLTLQKERLYEAMCTQRAWKFQDWQAFLREHPIVGRYCQQLVWAVWEQKTDSDSEMPAQPLLTFRPLADSTLTDTEDNAVTVEPDALIRIAHASLLPISVAEAWQTHLSDYEVEPLFDQLGQVYRLPEEQKTQTAITEFEGHLIDSFQLRGKATKLGYVRGQTEDGGWFYHYRKPFASLELEAVIEFTGNFVPEESRTVALKKLSFFRLSETEQNSYYYYYEQPSLPLSEIPAVLLSEAWNDLRNIAALGTGYDPEWEKKSEY